MLNVRTLAYTFFEEGVNNSPLKDECDMFLFEMKEIRPPVGMELDVWFCMIERLMDES